VEVLAAKTIAAAQEYRARHILMAGGVASNGALRKRLTEESAVPVMAPAPILCTDNAAMIAACAYYRFQSGKVDDLGLDVVSGLRLI